jgi:hypothetical protein
MTPLREQVLKEIAEVPDATLLEVLSLLRSRKPQTNPRQPRQPGSAIGTLTILADDEEHLQDFQNYMP